MSDCTHTTNDAADVTLNVTLLRRIKDWFRKYPESLDMDCALDKAESECGTVGCIAGHAVYLSELIVDPGNAPQWESIEADAIELLFPGPKLNFQYSITSKLFYGGYWSDVNATRYTLEEDAETRVDILCDEVERFITEWVTRGLPIK